MGQWSGGIVLKMCQNGGGGRGCCTTIAGVWVFRRGLSFFFCISDIRVIEVTDNLVGGGGVGTVRGG